MKPIAPFKKPDLIEKPIRVHKKGRPYAVHLKQQITLWVEPEEKKEIYAKAYKEGKPVSQWCRHILMENVRNNE